MKQILFTILLLPTIIFAQSFLISNIPLPKTYVMNLDPYPCDDECLEEFVENDMIFSFLAHANMKLDDDELDEIRSMSVSILNLGSGATDANFKIAMLLPYKKIGKYASSTTNATFSYLITKNSDFELKSYKVNSEDENDLREVLFQIFEDGFAYVIAPLTHKGAVNIAKVNPNLNIYIPTINKKDVEDDSSYIFYGGIDYKAQSDLLLKESSNPLVIFYDKSAIGNKLALYEEEQFLNPLKESKEEAIQTDGELEEEVEKKVYKYSIPKRTTNLERYLDNQKVVEASFFINTPIVKTSMIISQITLYDVNATNILSTQINYDPLILSMTQYADRKDMIIANSLIKNNNVLTESNALLNNDIIYDWINYSTTVGIDLFYTLATNKARDYELPLVENQIIYPIELISPKISKFATYIRASEE